MLKTVKIEEENLFNDGFVYVTSYELTDLQDKVMRIPSFFVGVVIAAIFFVTAMASPNWTYANFQGNIHYTSGIFMGCSNESGTNVCSSSKAYNGVADFLGPDQSNFTIYIQIVVILGGLMLTFTSIVNLIIFKQKTAYLYLAVSYFLSGLFFVVAYLVYINFAKGSKFAVGSGSVCLCISGILSMTAAVMTYLERDFVSFVTHAAREIAENIAETDLQSTPKSKKTPHFKGFKDIL